MLYLTLYNFSSLTNSAKDSAEEVRWPYRNNKLTIFIMHLKAQGVFSFLFSCNFNDLFIPYQKFTGLFMYAYVGIHQVRILVFENHETCPVLLKGCTSPLRHHTRATLIES